MYYKISTTKRIYDNNYSFITFKERIITKKQIIQELNKYMDFWKNRNKQVFIRHFYNKNIITNESRFFIEIKILNKENQPQEILRYTIIKETNNNYKNLNYLNYFNNDIFLKKILPI